MTNHTQGKRNVPSAQPKDVSVRDSSSGAYELATGPAGACLRALLLLLLAYSACPWRSEVVLAGTAPNSVLARLAEDLDVAIALDSFLHFRAAIDAWH